MAHSNLEMRHPHQDEQTNSTKPRGQRGLWAMSMSTAVSRVSKFIGVGSRRASKQSALDATGKQTWMRSASEERLKQSLNLEDGSRHKESRRRRRRTTDGYALSIATSTTKVDKPTSIWSSVHWKHRSANPSRKGSLSTNGHRLHRHTQSDERHSSTPDIDPRMSISQSTSRDRSLPPSPLLQGQPWTDVRSDSECDPGMKSPGSVFSSDGTEYGLKTPPDNRKPDLTLPRRIKQMSVMPKLTQTHQSIYSITDGGIQRHQSGKAVIEGVNSPPPPPPPSSFPGRNVRSTNEGRGSVDEYGVRRFPGRTGSLDALSEKSYPEMENFRLSTIAATPRSFKSSQHRQPQPQPQPQHNPHNHHNRTPQTPQYFSPLASPPPQALSSPALSSVSYPSPSSEVAQEKSKTNRASRYRHSRHKSADAAEVSVIPVETNDNNNINNHYTFETNSLALHNRTSRTSLRTTATSNYDHQPAVIPTTHRIWRTKYGDVPNVNTPDKFMIRDKHDVAIGVEFERHWPYANYSQRSLQ